MKVLTEYYKLDYDVNVIKEQKEKNRPIVLSGVFQQGNIKNGNGRIYSKEILKREVQKYKELVEQRRAPGSLDHEDSPVISLEKVSHLVVAIDYNDDTGIVKGKLELLPTPSGKIAEALLEGGLSVGISSRGVGSVRTEEVEGEEVEIVEDDYQILCWDIVSQGSVPNTWLQKEAKEYFGVNIRYPSTQDINRLLTKEARLRNVLTEILQK